MSKPATIIGNLKTLLQDSSDLSYVSNNNILLGYRQGLVRYPMIILEPSEDVEEDITHNRQHMTFSIAVMGFIKVSDKDKQIVGSGSIKGVLDMLNDVKKAISSDRTIDSSAIWTRILKTDFDIEAYPVRSFTINIEVEYRQNSTTRT